jgi:hypothetical protein
MHVLRVLSGLRLWKRCLLEAGYEKPICGMLSTLGLAQLDALTQKPSRIRFELVNRNIEPQKERKKGISIFESTDVPKKKKRSARRRKLFWVVDKRGSQSYPIVKSQDV